MSTSKQTAYELIERLERREEELDHHQGRVEEFGEESLAELADAYESFMDVLEAYQDQVTGDDGDIQTIVEFQSEIDRVMSSIPDNVLLSGTFDECDEYLQQKWFSHSDFEHVYEQLEPVADVAARLDDRDEALAAYRKARSDVKSRLRDCKREIEDLDRLAELADADLDAPVERLRDPIETYNDAIRESFREFKREESARTVLAFVDQMDSYPLVDYEKAPADVAEFVREDPPGEEPIPDILEYADYSRSKLEHYVEDPDRLKHAIEGHRAYLNGLDAEPLTIDWPPLESDALTYRCRELTAAVNRIDPAVVEHLRSVQELPRETAYDRLRNSAIVRQDLDDEERERLQSGDIEDELEQRRIERAKLENALETYPDR